MGQNTYKHSRMYTPYSCAEASGPNTAGWITSALPPSSNSSRMKTWSLIGDSMGSTDGKVIFSDECTARSGLTWSVVHVVVVGWMFSGVGCHATSKGAELSCELYYTISFWSWILSWKSQHFVDLSTFCGYYPHFVDIYVLSG